MWKFTFGIYKLRYTRCKWSFVSSNVKYQNDVTKGEKQINLDKSIDVSIHTWLYVFDDTKPLKMYFVHEKCKLVPFFWFCDTIQIARGRMSQISESRRMFFLFARYCKVPPRKIYSNLTEIVLWDGLVVPKVSIKKRWSRRGLCSDVTRHLRTAVPGRNYLSTYVLT